MMKNITLSLLFVFLFCAGNSQSEFQIKGKIKNSTSKKVWVYNYSKSISDTISLNFFNKFSFSNKISHDELLFIKPLESNSSIVLNVKEDSKIKFKTKLPNINKNLRISGNEITSNSSEFYNWMSQYKNKIQEAENKMYKDETADGQYYYDSIITSLTNQANDCKNSFVIENSGKSDLFVVNDFIDYENDYELLLELRKGLKKKHSKSEMYSKVEDAIFKYEMYQSKVENIGDEVPVLLLPDLNGMDISTADFKGEYFLIDFWASWCSPCRAEHPRLIKLYEEYHKKGFEIYSISLDKNKEKWENAILKDKLSWDSHVSNLKMFNCPTVKVFNVRALPFNVLVDKNNKVIAFNIKGKELEEKLKQIFNERN